MLKKYSIPAAAFAALAACGGGAETPADKPAAALGAPGKNVAAVCERAMGWQAERVGPQTERGSRFLRGAKPCCAKGAGLASALDDSQRLVLWHKYFAFDPTKITYEEQQASRAAMDEATGVMNINALSAVNDVMVEVEVCIEDLDK
ncbi:MAG: hypothetical protein VX640_03965 [Pseudomonadota bacterium]|nr:hypothetical protein [Pseudomonadota bacterium]